MRASGRAALGSLRIEKGYRAWGSELTPEYGPVESGLGWTVRKDDRRFVGGDAVGSRASTRTLRCLVIDDEQTVMGSEAVVSGDASVGYVTSGAWCPSIGSSVAYAWVGSGISEGDRVEVMYLDRRLPATVSPEPLFDPAGERVRS